MLKNLTDQEKYIIYRAMLNSIKEGCDDGFASGGQCHPVYVCGASGNTPHALARVDSPDKNEMFGLMLELSCELDGRLDIADDELISGWQDFCRLAVQGYHNRRARLEKAEEAEDDGDGESN